MGESEINLKQSNEKSDYEVQELQVWLDVGIHMILLKIGVFFFFPYLLVLLFLCWFYPQAGFYQVQFQKKRLSLFLLGLWATTLARARDALMGICDVCGGNMGSCD